MKDGNVTAHWKRDFPVHSTEDSYVTRREFTKFLGLTSLAFFLGTLAAAGRTVARRLLHGDGRAFDVAGLGEIPVGGYKLFRHPASDDPCILIRLAEEKFAAFDQRCTHLACPVVFDAATTRLACPCHAGYFNAEDGKPLGGPPKRGLARLEVTTGDARVWVRVAREESA